MRNQKKIVSICCITYNHVLFIRKALEGFLMQEPPSCVKKGAKISDWCEILIHDDASTDGTDAIIQEYSNKYPDLFFPIFETENQYSRGGAGRMSVLYNYNRARGIYVAYCEGDDYWTDRKKLQKQVDWMETHPEYSVCFHDFENYDVRQKKQYPSQEAEWYINKSELGSDLKITDYFKRIGQPLTMLFRVSMFDFEAHNRYQYYRDTHEIYHLLRAGKGYWMNFIGGIYNLHDGGISTSTDIYQKCWEEREHVLELYVHNRQDQELREYLIKILLWNHDVFKREGQVTEFIRAVKPYWKNVPAIMAQVYWILVKREIKYKLRNQTHDASR